MPFFAHFRKPDSRIASHPIPRPILHTRDDDLFTSLVLISYWPRYQYWRNEMAASRLALKAGCRASGA